MTNRRSNDQLPALSGLVPLLALVRLGLHLLTNVGFFGYGYFRDEFYYWVGSQRLAWGYVDHPPLAPLLLRLTTETLGESMFAMRLPAALAGAATVYLSGLMARELGGSKAAQALSALTVALAPILLIFTSFYSPNAFAFLWWALITYLLLRLLRRDRPQLWLAVGLVAGVGLQNKHTMLLLGLGIAAGLLLTPARRYLRSRWLWLGGGLALLLALPNFLWQVANGWPSLEFYANATLYKNVTTSPPEILLTQILVFNPFALPLWLAGLYYFLWHPAGRRYRTLGWVYLALLALMIAAQSSRPDRIAGAYPMLFAAGAVLVERLAGRGRRPRLRLAAVTAAVLLGAAIMLPVSLPLLPPQPTARMATAMGIAEVAAERDKSAALPQYLADRFGWRELARTVAAVYAELPAEEQAQAAILTTNYGEAGAIDFFGRQAGLPPAISGHNHYYLWGPGPETGAVVITVNYPAEGVGELFAAVEPADTFACELCMDYEDDAPILVARHLQIPLQQAWQQVKHYD